MEPAIPQDSDAVGRSPRGDTTGAGAREWTPGWIPGRVGPLASDDIAARIAALPDPAQRARRLPRLIGLNVRYGCLYGEVYIAPNLDGAAIWLAPSATTLTFGRMARAGMLTALLRVGWRALARMATMEGFAARMRHRQAPMPHWYLAQLGIEPARQGRGIDSALIRSMLAHRC